MKKIIFNPLYIITCILSCSPYIPSSTSENGKTVSFEDKIYANQIKTVLLYPDRNQPKDYLQPAALPLSGGRSLILEFDDLRDSPENYYAKIFYCDRDWKQSIFPDLQFLSAYNEFYINDYAYSIDTKIPYVHYRLELPAVKLSGNYLLLVYRNNPSHPVITRRFMVYQNRVEVQLAPDVQAINPVRRGEQEVKFKIMYKGLDLRDPLENVSVVIRQNQRWDNAVINLKPNFVREDLKELDFRYFNLENAIKGNNEFRFFDLRSVRNYGQNVEKVINSPDHYTAIIEMDKPRTNQAYGHLYDFDGNYTLDNLDHREPDTGSEYVSVLFTLQSDSIRGQVYIIGELTNWEMTMPMQYNSQIHGYVDSLLLKQGWYNYLYQVKSETLPSYYLEGSHGDTENQYEIFVYYRDVFNRNDALIGYRAFTMHPD